jgi:hypothetical protein
VDFSNTAMAFANKESIIRKYNIIIKKLLVLRPLRLADSIPTLFITDYFTAWISIGPYTEAILFLITKLSPTTLIILGMP